MILEVIVQDGYDARVAELAGADRLELVSAMSEGGLTPSYGVIKNVLETVKIPVYVMVRPHGYHFCYKMKEWEIIKEDIRIIKELGAAGIVFGCLTEDGVVDEELLSKVIDISDGLGITFHRAFDEVPDQEEAYKTLSAYSGAVERILTSGGKEKAEYGIEPLQKLIALKKTLKGPEILVGSGLTANNIKRIHRFILAEEYHFGSGVRVNQSFKQSIDTHIIQNILNDLS